MKNTPSLMKAPVVATPILDQFRKALTPSTGKEPTLEEKLSALSEPDLKTVMAQSRIAHMSARMQRKVTAHHLKHTVSYYNPCTLNLIIIYSL